MKPKNKFPNLIRIYFTLAFLCLVNTIGHGQELQIDVSSSNFGPDQGLPSSELYHLLQDRNGYIWIASDNGITKFDGSTFKHFTTEQGLDDNVVLHLAEMPDGGILCATLSNRLFILKGDSVCSFRNEFIFKNQIMNEEIPNDLQVWPDGTVGLGVNISGTSLLTPEGKIIGGFKNSEKGIWVTEKNDQLIAGVWNTRLDYVPGFDIVISKGDKKTELRIENETLIYGPCRALKFENSVIISNGNNIFIIDEDGELNIQKLETNIFCLSNSDKHGLLVGTSQRGIQRFKSLDDLLQGKSDRWIDNTSISDLLTIEGGGVWASSLDAGLFFIPSPNIECSSIKEGLVGISHINNKAIALSMHTGVFFEKSEGSLAWSPMQIPSIEDASGLHYDNDYSTLYSFGRELMYYQNHKWNPVLDLNNQAIVGVLKIHEGRGNKLWISGRHNFDLIDRSSRKSIDILANKSFNHRIICIFEDSKEDIWISTTDGLFKGNLNKLSPLDSIGGHKIIGRIEAIAQLKSSIIAFGIKGQGLILYDLSNNTSTLIDTNHGLFSSIIEDITSNDNDELYIGTTAGVQRLLLDGFEILRIQNLNKPAGMLTNEVNQLMFADNSLFVMSTKGITEISEWPEENTAPKLIINKIICSDRFIDPQSTFKLNYPENGLRVEFTGFQYYHPTQVKFRYRILHEDDNWHETKSNALNISELNSCDYHIEIQAGVNQIWSESQHVKFKVNGPYWKSWWFITLAFILLAALIYIGLRWLLMRLRKGDIIEKKMVYLERSALLSQMNPHFIFNSLNSIQSYIANNENDKANRFLAKFSRLIRAMLNHSRSAKVTLQDEIDSLALYLDMEKMRFKEKFTYSITVDDEIDSHDIELPPMLIQPYLENAIIHGLAKKGGPGRIELFYLLHGNYLVVTVTDNGIGIEQSKKLNSGINSSLHKSVGMTITQKRLELLDDTKDDKKVFIEEVKDREGKVLGTKVEVKIKVY